MAGSLYQFYSALKNLSQTPMKSDYHLLYKYFISKLLLLFLEVLRNALIIRTFPSSSLGDSSSKVKFGFWLIDIIWIVVDLLYLIVLITIYQKAKRGFCWQMNHTFNRGDLERLAFGIAVVVKGIPLKGGRHITLMQKSLLAFLKGFQRVRTV